MRIIEQLFSILAPYSCISCGREGALLCAWCLPDAFTPVPERCYRCHALSRGSKVCDKCRKLAPIGHVWVAVEYEGYAKQLVTSYKFARAKDVAAILAARLHETVPFTPEGTIVTFVPTATSRVRERGYDHAEVMARSFAALRDLDCIPLLYRMGQTRQVGSKRSQRITQLAGAFRTRNDEHIKGAKILLIDDIVTTGASLAAASKVLKSAGAKSLDAAVFAQKQ